MRFLAKRLNELKDRAGLSGNSFAEKCGVKPTTMHGYLNDKYEPKVSELVQIARAFEVSLGWLADGQEDQRPTGEPSTARKAEEAVAATISPARTTPRDAIIKQRAAALIGNHQPPKEGPPDGEYKIEENIKIADMVTMTIEVLESDTVYRQALASNVRAFHKAVKQEGEMAGLQEMVQEMAQRMERMEQMLLSLGAKAAEKRDSAASA